ncbi:MAG: MJ0042-type zinc finger domain-containing protein, partial [Advenella sp.]
MKTRCPDCSTSFDVTPAQLNVRNGKVRCGVCSTVFDAFDHAVEEDPDFPVLRSVKADDDAFSVRHEPGPVYHHPARAGDRQGHPSVSTGRYQEAAADPRMDQAFEPTLDNEDDEDQRDNGDDGPASRIRRAQDTDRAAGERFVVGAPSLSGSGAY